MWKKAKPWIISIAVALGTCGLSALLTKDSMGIYKTIITPPLSPPSVVFPIVWTILFTLMGISAALIYTSHLSSHSEIKNALVIYAVNLVLNFFWTIIFFNAKAYALAFVWILALLAVIIAMTVKFNKIRPFSAYLQIPYVLWTAFAAYLNLGVAILNK